MRAIIVILGVLVASMAPAHANAPSQPKLTGYICIDQRGLHHRASAVFEGVFCTLVPNPKYRG